MKLYKLKVITLAAVVALFTVQCSNDDNGDSNALDFSGTYSQQDQMGRPKVGMRR